MAERNDVRVQPADVVGLEDWTQSKSLHEKTVVLIFANVKQRGKLNLLLRY